MEFYQRIRGIRLHRPALEQKFSLISEFLISRLPISVSNLLGYIRWTIVELQPRGVFHFACFNYREEFRGRSLGPD